MTNEEIKNECEIQYAAIKTAENRLKELRDICKHEETFEGNYSWRIGAIEPAIICKFCNEPISFPARPDYSKPILPNI